MRSRLPRIVVRGALAALAIALLAPASAQAAARAVDEACVFADKSTFADRPEGEVGSAIDCVAHYRITLGVTATQYAPQQSVRRDQMASFLVRLVQAANGTVNPSPTDHFDDDNGNTHETNINRLFETGITLGFPDETYRPRNFVTRAQMASFIARAIEHATGTKLPASTTNHFSDDNGNEHEARINQLADAGVVQGTSTGKYSPGNFVTRGQMALFLARSLAFMTDDLSQPLRRIDPSSAAGVIADATAAPELVGAARVASGQVVRFTFDEEVNAGALVPGSFRAYTFTAAQTVADSVVRDSADSKSVLATFPTALRLDLVTTVAAARGAVQDAGGLLSIEGSAPLSAVDLPSGTTEAPDLTGASAVGSNNTNFNFQFDEPAYRLTNNGYRLVLSDGTTVTSTGSTGDGTTTHTATFPQFDPSKVVRAYIVEGTVSDAQQVAQSNPLQEVVEGNANPQQAVAVANGGVVTGRPDLSSITVNQADDTVTYRFDENVTPATATPIPGSPNSGTYRIYYLNGDSVSSTDSEKSTTDPRSIIVTFGDGEVSNLVAGASVDQGAVTSTASGGANLVDEQGVATKFAAGRTAAPDLIGVGHTQTASNTPPNSINRAVVFLFDQPVDAVNLNGTFAIYDANGVRTAFATNGIQPACAASGSRVTCTANSSASATVFAAILDATRAGVAQGAVQDLTETHLNPESSSSL